jgi:hypothetical protein
MEAHGSNIWSQTNVVQYLPLSLFFFKKIRYWFILFFFANGEDLY